MTQSDAPNEGREEKTAEEVYKESWNLLVNGEIHSSAILHAMKVYADQQTKSLRDQLSKERENKCIFSCDGPKHELEQFCGCYNQWHQELTEQLAKEREMRKELVSSLKNTIRNIALDASGNSVVYAIESVLKKASELDKNLKT